MKTPKRYWLFSKKILPQLNRNKIVDYSRQNEKVFFSRTRPVRQGRPSMRADQARRTAVCFPPCVLKMLVNPSRIACAFSLPDEKHPRCAVLRIFSEQIFVQGKESVAENTWRIVKADDAALPEICLKKRMGPSASLADKRRAALDKPPGFRCDAMKAAMDRYAIAADRTV